MEKHTLLTKKLSGLEVKSGLKAGYRPVHGLVAPDGWSNWVPGWFDMDSVGKLAAGAGSTPPPPPQE